MTMDDTTPPSRDKVILVRAVTVIDPRRNDNVRDKMKSLHIFRTTNPDGKQWTPTINQLCILQNIERQIKQSHPGFLEDVVVPIIMQTGKVSLRVMDWLITQYSKQHDIRIHGLSVHQSYNDSLRVYRRSNFDVFRRRNRVQFTANRTDIVHYTTIAQLNFFLWAHKIDLLRYMESNAELLESELAAETLLAANKRRARSESTTVPTSIRAQDEPVRTDEGNANAFRISVQRVSNTVEPSTKRRRKETSGAASAQKHSRSYVRIMSSDANTVSADVVVQPGRLPSSDGPPAENETRC